MVSVTFREFLQTARSDSVRLYIYIIHIRAGWPYQAIQDSGLLYYLIREI